MIYLLLLSFFGFDQDFKKAVAIPAWESKLSFSAYFHETFFYSTVATSDVGIENQPSELFTFRWKEQTELHRQITIPLFTQASLGLKAVFGQQPLPVDILPRLWDYTHQIDSFPEVGTLLGVGPHFMGHLSRSFALEANAGFYGGYWGGDLAAHWANWTFSAGSWGIEGRSAYQSLGSRLWSFEIASRF
jgi:hypothetical protein